MMTIAMCIPSYNRIDLIEELVDEYVPLYKEYNIDVYLYDSRDDGITSDIVNCAGLDNLHYLHTKKNIKKYPFVMHGNVKVLELYQMFSNNSKYDYVWVCGDGMRYERKCLDKLFVNLEDNSYDLITIRNKNNLFPRDIIYNSIQGMFIDFGWYFTLFGAVLVKRETLLDVEWKVVWDNYIRDEIFSFSHVCLLNTLGETKKNFKGIYLAMPKHSCYQSPRKIVNGWTRDIFNVLFEKWPSAVGELPWDEKVKRKILMNYYENVKFFDAGWLIRLRAEGIFNREICYKYVDLIEYISGLKKNDIVALADQTREDAISAVNSFRKRLITFIDNHKRIAIYGAGQIGKKVYRLLEREGYVGNICCFVVTLMDNNEEECLGKPVVELEKIDNQFGILLCVNEKNKEEILRTSLKEWNKEDLFCDSLSVLYMDATKS